MPISCSIEENDGRSMKNNSRDSEYIDHLRQIPKTIVSIHDDFSLTRIAQSGQCFRWQQIAMDTYRILHFDQSVYVSDHGNGMETFLLNVMRMNFMLFGRVISILEKAIKESGLESIHQQTISSGPPLNMRKAFEF